MKIKHSYKKSVVKSNYRVINCEKCGYWHVYPMPTEKELKAFYEVKYDETLSDDRTMTDKIRDADGFYAIQYEDRLRHIMKVFPPDLPKTVIDVGAGYGDFLRFMKDKRWNVAGLESSKNVHEQVMDREAINIKSGSINEISELCFAPASLVTLNNVLEHIREPRVVIEAIKKYLLLPKGILSVIVPNDFNPLQKLLMRTVLKKDLKKHYFWASPPEHLNYWSIEILKRFLLKCGFEILYCTVDFPMELFALMGEDYISMPEAGRRAHLRRVQFEKHIYDAKYNIFKDEMFESFARIGIGRGVQILCSPLQGNKK